MQLVAKKHNNKGRLILAICDKSILGKKFEEDDFILDLKSEFYNGSIIEGEELLNLIKKSYITNVVGVDSVTFLKEHKFIEDGEIKKICNIPFVQVLFDSTKPLS